MRAPFLRQGGGLYIDGGNAMLTSCSIFWNRADDGPGIYMPDGKLCLFDVPVTCQTTLCGSCCLFSARLAQCQQDTNVLNGVTDCSSPPSLPPLPPSPPPPSPSPPPALPPRSYKWSAKGKACPSGKGVTDKNGFTKEQCEAGAQSLNFNKSAKEQKKSKKPRGCYKSTSSKKRMRRPGTHYTPSSHISTTCT